MTYYEKYKKCDSIETIIEQVKQDIKIAIFLGNNPDRIKAIEDAMNKVIDERRTDGLEI